MVTNYSSNELAKMAKTSTCPNCASTAHPPRRVSLIGWGIRIAANGVTILVSTLKCSLHGVVETGHVL